VQALVAGWIGDQRKPVQLEKFGFNKQLLIQFLRRSPFGPSCTVALHQHKTALLTGQNTQTCSDIATTHSHSETSKHL